MNFLRHSGNANEQAKYGLQTLSVIDYIIGFSFILPSTVSCCQIVNKYLLIKLANNNFIEKTYC